MKHQAQRYFIKISSAIFLVFAIFLVGLGLFATPIKADDGLLQVAWNLHNNYWSDAGSSVALSSMYEGLNCFGCGEARRTHTMAYHVKGNPGFAWGWQMEFSLHAVNVSPETVYYRAKVEPITINPNRQFVAAYPMSGNLLEDVTGSFTLNGNGSTDVHMTDLYGNTDYTEFMVYMTFSLDPISPFPTNHVLIPAHVYVDNNEQGSINDWRIRLGDYFNEMNKVLMQSGSIKLLDWDQQVQLTHTEPFNRSLLYCNWGAREDVKIWFSDDPVIPTIGGDGISYGRDCDGYGTIVITTNYLSDNNPPPYLVIPKYADSTYWSQDNYNDYWHTVRAVLHELVHTYGGFAVEGYTYKDWTDSTNNLPSVDIHASNMSDRWWNGEFGGQYTHSDLRLDPMSGLFQDVQNVNYNFDTELALTKYSQLSVDFIDSPNYRSQMRINVVPYQSNVVDQMTYDFGTLHVTQNDLNGNPVNGIIIKAWFIGVASVPFNITSYIGEYTTVNGQVDVPWNAWPETPMFPNLSRNAVLLKSYIVENGNYIPYGDPQIIDEYNLQLKVFDNGAAITSYPITLTSNKVGLSGNVGVSNATITYNGGTTTSNNDGTYVIYVDSGWSGTVTPTKTGYTFTPSNYTYNNITADQSLQNFTVTQQNTTTTITSDSPDPSTVGQSVAVHYTVIANSGTPTGNVTISDGTDSCTATVAAGSCNITLNTAGTRSLTATYAGDSNYYGSNSSAESHTVNYNTGSITVNATGGNTTGSIWGWNGTGRSNQTSGDFIFGDSPTNQPIRSIVQFDTSSIPDNAVIDNFTVNFTINGTYGDLHGFGPSGNDAFTVEMANGCYGNCYVENSDWESSSASTVGNISLYPVSNKKVYSITASSGNPLSNISKTGSTDFKLLWNTQTDNDNTKDESLFYTAGSNNPPTITINYHY